MNKIIFFLLLVVLAISFLAISCSKADVKPRNADNTLSSMWATVPGVDENSSRYNGVFNAKKDTVTITVPQKASTGRQIRLDSLKLRGSIPSDAVINPGFGLTNLNSPVKIEITSGTNATRTYWIITKQLP